MKKKKVDQTEVAISQFRTKTDSRNQRWMICQNSEPYGRYWQKRLCSDWVKVDSGTVAVLCWKCVQQNLDPMEIKTVTKSDKPKGWKFMKVYVHVDGTVYHKGEEQPSLKGTLPVTVIQPKPDKKKLTKQEKESAKNELGKKITELKASLFHETRKGKRADIVKQLSKANRELKKLI
jgi:hypothetical protein